MNTARDVKGDLTGYLGELHLPAIRQCFEEKARQAERETLSYEQYLLDLAERECQERRENRIARLLRESKLPLEKTMENFDLKRLPLKAARQVKALLDGAFLDRKENVLAFGNPGSGKTHLLSALGQELIRTGRKIGFITCARLVQDLLRAKKELRLSRAIQKLAHYEGLVIDDLGYVQQNREEMEVLFAILAERYERGISNNLGSVKCFLSVLLRARYGARHFAHVYLPPSRQRLACNLSGGTQSDPSISPITTSIMITISNSLDRERDAQSVYR